MFDSLDAAFEAEFADWLARLYAVHAERILTLRLARIYGIGWLTITIAIVAVPMLGLGALVAGVGLLVATLVLVWTAAVRSGLEPRGARQTLRVRGSTASTDVPRLGPDERARLVRLMNLSRAAWRPATRMLLRAELREARSCGSLAHWRPLIDLEETILSNAFAINGGE